MTMDYLRQIADGVRYKGWVCMVRADIDGKPYLQWGWHADCAVTGVNQWWTSRKHMLSVHMTEGEVVQTAFYAALQAEEHECRESFRYKGDRPFQPHINFHALCWASRQTEGRPDVRNTQTIQADPHGAASPTASSCAYSPTPRASTGCEAPPAAA